MKNIIFVLCMVFSFNVLAANIEATVNRNIVPIDEVFMLTITADDNLNDRPDLSVLSPDFNVYSNSVSKSTYVINGKTTRTTKWQIGISANNEGKQTIPSIKVGKDASNEVVIDVLPAGSAVSNNTNNVDYSMKTKIDEYKTWYVQEQIPYTVVITDTGGLQGGEPIFDNSDDWIIKSLGNPDVASQYVNGVNVREIKFKYILFAQKSGNLKIPAVRFNGYKISNNGGGIFIGNILSLNVGMPSSFGFEEPINLVAPSKSINIKPVPADYKGKWWLPAKSVEIKADFVDTTEFIEGEAFSREIIVSAVGVIDTQLPELNFEDGEFLKQYPQKSISSNSIIDNEPVATQKTVNVYIPEKFGEIVLPAISVEWFNVITGKTEIAKINAQKIYVKKNPNFRKQIESPKQDNIVNTTINNEVNTLTLWQVVSLMSGVFVVGILLGYYIFKCRRTTISKPQCEVRTYPDFIIKKAQLKDYKALRDALISWAIGFYPEKNISTLKDIAMAAEDKKFAEQIELLTAKLYSSTDTKDWDAQAFVGAYKNITKKNKVKSKNKLPLPNLYQ